MLFLMDTKPFQVAGRRARGGARRSSRRPSRWRGPTSSGPSRWPQQNALSQKDLDDATGQFHAAEAAVEEAKARLESAKLDLSYCTIVSPVAGITGAAQQQDGTYISPQNSLLTTVAVLSPIWVNFSISENQMQSYRDQARQGASCAPPRTASTRSRCSSSTARSSRTPAGSPSPSPSYNAQTGHLPAPRQRRQPGRGPAAEPVRARRGSRGRSGRSAILVPQRAVQQGAEGQFVWVVGEGRHGRAASGRGRQVAGGRLVHLRGPARRANR